ncbi:MAG: hypothetical protein ACJ79U_12770, partial [Myxococcales bacterium]
MRAGEPMNLEELRPFQGGRRAFVVGGIVGAAGLVLTLVGGFFDPTHAILSYIVAYMFWLGVCIGALALNMSNYAARALAHRDPPRHRGDPRAAAGLR